SLTCPRPPTSTLFPYTTLFRSGGLALHGQHPIEVFLRVPERRGIAIDGRQIGNRCRQAPQAGSDRAAAFVGDGLESPGIIHAAPDRKSTRLNSSHVKISYAVFC